MRRVVITGLGVLGPTGVGVVPFWQAVLHGPSAIGRISNFDPSSYGCQIAGEVKDRSYENLLDSRTLRTTARVTQLAIAAATLAVRDARLEFSAVPPDRRGVCIGTAIGGWLEAERQLFVLRERGAQRANPFLISGAPNYAPGVEIASRLDAQGLQATSSVGCPASLHAIGEGARLVAEGRLDICVVGGAESPVTPLVIAGMSRSLELCTTHNDQPQKASRPFDRDHAGMVVSEGSCMLVLEAAEYAERRGAYPYAAVTGFATSCDGKGLYALDGSGEVAARTVHKALRCAKIDVAQVDYVCSHANSSPAFDRKETQVLKRALGECAPRVAISSIKAVLGHPFGASGAFQVAAAALAIRHGLVPPTHNLDTPDPRCDLDYVPLVPRPVSVTNALVSSYGYGGTNAFVVLSSPENGA